MIHIVSAWRLPDGTVKTCVTRVDPRGTKPVEAVASHAAAFRASFSGDPQRRADGTSLVASLPRYDETSYRGAEETSYCDRAGCCHGVFVSRTPFEEQTDESRAEAERARQLALSGNYEEAARASQKARKLLRASAGEFEARTLEALHREFPQWTRWHADDEAKGIVRSDAPRGEP